MFNDTDDWDDMPLDDQEDETDWDESAETETVEEVEAPADPPVEVDPEDPIVFPEQFYEVQSSYEQGDQVIDAGTSIQIKCENCAVWEAPLQARGGKPLCRPGQPFLLPAKEGEEPVKWRMQRDRYSCQEHFIPQDMQDVLQFLTDDIDQVRMLLWCFPTLAKFVKLQNRVKRFHAKHGGDAEKTINALLDFVVLFESEQQIQLVKPFIKRVVDGLAATKKPRRTGKASFKAGDEVSWEAQPGVRVQGFIRSIGGRNKNVTIIVTDPYVQKLAPGSTQKALQWQRPVTEWKQMSPEKVSSIPVVTDE